MRNAVRKLRTLARASIGKDFFIRPDIRCRTERVGSTYGGWNIVADDISSTSVVLSFGVGEDASFDLGLIDRFGLTVHAFDPTPKSIQWVAGQGFPDAFVMHEYGIAAFDGTVSFNPPDNPDHVSHTMLGRPSTEDRAIDVPVKRLATIMSELGIDHIDILKMDIEGAEYDVLDDIEASGIRPQQVLIEFHHRFPNVSIDTTRRAIATLRSMGYAIFAVSATNQEICLIRRQEGS